GVLGRARASGPRPQVSERLGALCAIRTSRRPSPVTPPWRIWISPATPGRCYEPGPLRLCGEFVAALAGRGAPVRRPAAVDRQPSGPTPAGHERVLCGGAGCGGCIG